MDTMYKICPKSKNITMDKNHENIKPSHKRSEYISNYVSNIKFMRNGT